VYAANAGAGSGFSLAELSSRPKLPCASVLVRALVWRVEMTLMSTCPITDVKFDVPCRSDKRWPTRFKCL
jgi:hypothetical protein